MWDKWTPGVAARSLLMPLLGCVGWHWHCGPDGESMAGAQMPVFSLLVALVWGQMHKRAELGPQCQPHIAVSFSPIGMWGCGHWQVASSDFPSNKLFLESVGCEPQTEILLSCFSQKLSPSWPGTAQGKDTRHPGLAAGLWAGSAQLPAPLTRTSGA